MLSGIPKAVSRLNDILVAGTDKDDHLRTLSLVLEHLRSAGFKLNKTECKFLQQSVVYLGHKLDGEGLHPSALNLQPPMMLQGLRMLPHYIKSFLGLIMFYSRFIPHHSTELAPLHNLLRKDTRWRWSKIEEDAFQQKT